MTDVGIDNFDLVKYLISQVMLSDNDRYEALKEYFPGAKKEDWRLGLRANVCRSSRKTLKKAAYCVWAPKWLALKMAASRHC
ncbi:Malate:quinone oxidoreductase [Ewingella americana]|uniref:malate dehydrogenase (quinone) n=1 Tax=Ewingella americana TaxID=41202 RepID=A0A377N6Y6_9GAMM|nr:Malate:quinone oxidoreductase [Ewingella americana]